MREEIDLCHLRYEHSVVGDPGAAGAKETANRGDDALANQRIGGRTSAGAEFHFVLAEPKHASAQPCLQAHGGAHIGGHLSG